MRGNIGSNPERGGPGEHLESGAAESREIRFEDFSLDSLEWKRGESERIDVTWVAKADVTNSTAEQELMVNGVPCTLEARMEAHEFVSGGEDDVVLFSFYTIGEDGKTVLWADINSHLGYRGDNDQALVGTSIKKESHNPRFEGLGIRFYEKMLDFIASGLGKTLGNKAVRHEVERAPARTIKGKLSDERWNEIFLPILEARGYKQARDGFFEREYPAPGEAARE